MTWTAQVVAGVFVGLLCCQAWSQSSAVKLGEKSSGCWLPGAQVDTAACRLTNIPPEVLVEIGGAVKRQGRATSRKSSLSKSLEAWNTYFSDVRNWEKLSGNVNRSTGVAGKGIDMELSSRSSTL